MTNLIEILKKPVNAVRDIVRNPQKRKEYLVNTFTPMPFFQTAFFLNEYFIGGSKLDEAIKTRGINIGLAILFNDFMFGIIDWII